jgi:hypothetical protein
VAAAAADGDGDDDDDDDDGGGDDDDDDDGDAFILPLPDILHKVQCIAKAPLYHCEGLLPLGWITTQGKNVLQAGLFHLFQGIVQLVHRHVGACEMHHGLNTKLQ